MHRFPNIQPHISIHAGINQDAPILLGNAKVGYLLTDQAHDRKPPQDHHIDQILRTKQKLPVQHRQATMQMGLDTQLLSIAIFLLVYVQSQSVQCYDKRRQRHCDGSN